MKRYTIQIIAAFHTRQHAILSRFPDRSPTRDNQRRAMTRFGRLEINPEELDKLDQTTCVACRFIDPEMKKAVPYGANPLNGKWCVIGYDPQKVLDELERGLALAEARALTDEERAAWEDQHG